MKKSFPGVVWSLFASRGVTPLVLGLFLMIYIGIAFSTEDALMALITLAASNIMLVALFALIPLNKGARLVQETREFLVRRAVVKNHAKTLQGDLYDETVTIDVSTSGLLAVDRRLASSGYRVVMGEEGLSAWRGISIFPARALFLLASVLLFSGVLISLYGRENYRGTIIEGVRLPNPGGGESGGVVNHILLAEAKGMFLAKSLTMEVAAARPDEATRVFGLYPPARYDGLFVYPRYLGIGLNYRLFAPDLPGGYEAHAFLSIYPPGKEASEEIPGSPYRIVFSLAPSDDGSDPYETGRMTFLFKLLKGKDVAVTGKAQAGEEFSKGEYRFSFPDARRLVITDFIHDSGVWLIWLSLAVYLLAGCLWTLLRLFFPRREMLFRNGADGWLACSRAEGGRRMHAGLFHEVLDSLEQHVQTDRGGVLR